jgi:uncharacterized protein (TIGR00299 family) protein
MKIALLDTVGGIAGDMTMAALVGAGMPFETLKTELGRLPLGGFHLEMTHVRRSAIDAVHIDVVVTDQPHYHRHLKDILDIIGHAQLSEGVRNRATQVFRVIAEAEAAVHNTTAEDIHFHEVGALDSIVDIVGTAVCLDTLGIEAVYSSPVKLGSGGLITTQHGVMPTPAPAVLEILKGYPVVLTSIPHELTTPTGAAIVKALSRGVLRDERIRVEAIGYGAGTKEFREIPNLLRAVIGELEGETEEEEVVSVETNIDDMNPQLYPHLIDRLLAAGAHDAYLIPVIMKKGRPGIIVSVIVNRSGLDAVAGCLFRETPTIGLRIHETGRRKLPRRNLTMATSFGAVLAKAVLRDGREVITAEFEECKRIALEHNLPVLEVMRQLEKELGRGRSG